MILIEFNYSCGKIHNQGFTVDLLIKSFVQDTNCNFMKWIEASNEDELRFQIFEKDTTIAKMEFQQRWSFRRHCWKKR